MRVASGRVGRIVFFRLEEGSDLLASMREHVEAEDIKSGFLACIGALSKARLGYFLGQGKYKAIEVQGPLEIASCVGNISVGPEGETVVHAHICVCDEEGRAYGGHLLEGCLVSPTAEVTVVELSGALLTRELDAKTGLKLLSPKGPQDVLVR